MFQLLSVITSFTCLFFGWLCGWRGKEASRWPRMRLPGILLGTVCLAFSAWYGCLMLEGGLAKYQPLAWALVPITAVLSYFFLDFLFARSLGGFLILSANALIHFGFVEKVPLRGVFSVNCLVLGVLGLFLLGTPWWMRDVMLWSEGHPTGRKWLMGAFALSAMLLLLSFGSI